MSNNPTVRYDLRMVLPTDSLLERAALQELGRTRGNVVQSSTPSRVADALREQISGGKFPPGARLREEAVAEALQVSRNTVREAFVELTGDRLVVREPNRGVFVATLTATDVMDIIAARRIIEVAAVRNGGSPVLLANARLAASEGMAARDAGDDDAAARADRHFHRALVAFASSTRLNRLIRQMLAEIRWVLNANNVDSTLFFAFVDDNQSICRQLEAGKQKAAARTLDDILTRTEHEIIRAVRTSPLAT